MRPRPDANSLINSVGGVGWGGGGAGGGQGVQEGLAGGAGEGRVLLVRVTQGRVVQLRLVHQEAVVAGVDQHGLVPRRAQHAYPGGEVGVAVDHPELAGVDQGDRPVPAAQREAANPSV